MTVIRALRKERQKDYEFKIIPGYIVSSRPAWIMWDPASNSNNNDKNSNKIPEASG